MELSYVAYSERSALLLDEEGICRWVVPLNAKPTDSDLATARQCVGAQYVASLDASAPGLLDEEPRIGSRLLLIQYEGGRAKLMRFGPLVRFETLDESAEFALERIAASIEPLSTMTLPVEPQRIEPQRIVVAGEAPTDDVAGASFAPVPTPAPLPVLYVDAAVPDSRRELGLDAPSFADGYGISPLDLEYASWGHQLTPSGWRLFLR